MGFTGVEKKSDFLLIAIVAGTKLKGEIILKARRQLNPETLSIHLMGKENTAITRAARPAM
jgi:hypothetical protein